MRHIKIDGEFVGLGGSGGGNATVPEDAGLQPPQAMVDFYNNYISSNIVFGGARGFTRFRDLQTDEDYYGPLTSMFDFAYYASSLPYIDLSGNALPAAEVTYLLDRMVGGAAGGYINLSGGMNADIAPQNFSLSWNGAAFYGEPSGVVNDRPRWAANDRSMEWNGAQWQLRDTLTDDILDLATSGDAPAPWQATGWAFPVVRYEIAVGSVLDTLVGVNGCVVFVNVDGEPMTFAP